MKEVVVLGGGFAGVSCIKQLLKHPCEDIHITLIDKKDFQLFTPSLYEVATSEEPKQNIALPYKELFGEKITTVVGTIESVDTQKQKIFLNSKETYPYDYLLFALGSEPAFYQIPGLEKYSLTLKTLEDSLKIKNQILSLCCKEKDCHKKTKVIIGGGGFAGVELAAELVTYKDRLAKQHHLAKDCLEICIIQGSDRLLKELDKHVSDIAQKRMQNPQVTFCFGGHIEKVTKDKVYTDNGNVYSYDIFIWTGGVKANKLLEKTQLSLTDRKQLTVDRYLRVEGKRNIFAAGDVAEFIDEHKKSPPTVAQVAEEEGVIAGENIYRSITMKELVSYHIRHWGYIVPLKGKFAAAELMGKFHVDGFLGWLLQQLVFLYYLLHVLPWWKALRRWNTFEVHLEQ